MDVKRYSTRPANIFFEGAWFIFFGSQCIMSQSNRRNSTIFLENRCFFQHFIQLSNFVPHIFKAFVIFLNWVGNRLL